MTNRLPKLTVSSQERWTIVHMVLKSTDGGHVMRVIANKHSAPTFARLATDYLFTGGRCMELYYMLKGISTLEVKVRGEDIVERKLYEASLEVNNAAG